LDVSELVPNRFSNSILKVFPYPSKLENHSFSSTITAPGWLTMHAPCSLVAQKWSPNSWSLSTTLRPCLKHSYRTHLYWYSYWDRTSRRSL